MTKEIQPTKKTLSQSSVFSYDAYQSFGVHPTRDKKGYLFRVFAPNADSVSVCGDFNSWDPRIHPMQKIGESGVWELVLEKELPKSCKYKYFLRRGGTGSFKADPFAFCAEKNPNGASVTESLEEYAWRDSGWLSYREKYFGGKKKAEQPICIYRVDPLWWRRHGNGSLYHFRELADELIPYAKQMGYTHIELIGITGGFSKSRSIPDALFAPSPSLGNPRELMSFIDSAHEAGIGVILAWNPFSFEASEHGLSDFDGTPLFESVGEKGNVRFFDLERNEIKKFLMANALFWVKKYHADGLSIDPSLSRQGREEAFLRALQARMRAEAPDIIITTGKKPNIKSSVMGCEFGDTWTVGCERTLAWQLLDQHMHAEQQLSVARENHSHLSAPPGAKGGGAAKSHTGINKD